jgi:hypothetical protein
MEPSSEYELDVDVLDYVSFDGDGYSPSGLFEWSHISQTGDRFECFWVFELDWAA